MEVKNGFNKTDLGIYPDDWSLKPLRELCVKIQDGTHFSPKTTGGPYLYVTSKNIKFGFLDISNADTIDKAQHDSIYRRCDVKEGDLLLTKDGANTGNAAMNNISEEFSLLSSVAFLRFDSKKYDSQYFLQQILSSSGQYRIKEAMSGNAITRLTLEKINKLCYAFPSRKSEQTAIATALSNADALISSLEKLIAKKRNIKQGAMQQLLQPKEGWEVKKLGEVADCLDYLRVPLNDAQRTSMKGDIPYCGANGVVDYVNDFVVNDDIILMAEDGGYFDEYKTRPIAYRMNGKCWVNNHAHILKAKEDYDQGFLFYSLVHKNVMDYINGGTRAKLNKGELLNIQLSLPNEKGKQISASSILNVMDTEIDTLEVKLEKYRQIKQGMMQQLLTGKIRLV